MPRSGWSACWVLFVGAVWLWRRVHMLCLEASAKFYPAHRSKVAVWLLGGGLLLGTVFSARLGCLRWVSTVCAMHAVDVSCDLPLGCHDMAFAKKVHLPSVTGKAL